MDLRVPVLMSTEAFLLALQETTGIPNILLNELLDNFGSIVIGLVAVVLGFLALRQQNKIAMDRLELEKKLYADQRLEWERRRSQMDEPSEVLAERLSERLIENPRWAHTALESARLLPYSNTLFGVRMHHFRAEKLAVARQFTPYLLKRCKHHIENDREAFLLIDGGTTLFPFFELIGQQTSQVWQARDESDWLERLHLATNNLPGVEELMRTGRKVEYDRYSDLAIEDCLLLPGKPLAVFGAVADDRTVAAIRAYREEHPQARFIALVVGNWVRLRNTPPICPVPLSRGPHHTAVKNAMIDVADEVFVISPLGKLFVGFSKQEVNEALGQAASVSGARDAYNEVNISPEKGHRVKLISTRRPSKERLLYEHSHSVIHKLFGHQGLPAAFTESDFAKGKMEDLPHLLFPFDDLPAHRQQEFDTEFPHHSPHTGPDLLRMFQV